MATSLTRARYFSQQLSLLTKAAIIGSGQTVKAVCAAVGIDSSTMSRYVAGGRAMPVDTFHNLCEAAGVDASELVVEADERTNAKYGPWQAPSEPASAGGAVGRESASAKASSVDVKVSSVGVKGSVDVVFTSGGRAVVPPSARGGVFGLAAKDVGYSVEEELEARSRNQP